MSAECQIIINNAASVDFTERLDNAVRINTLGPINLLEVARACMNLEICTHVSTAYVNCNKPGGFIEEKIYNDLEIDIDQFINTVLSMSVAEVEEKQLKMIGDFPNTYTFTKNLGERMLMNNRGDIPILIVRPSIIGCSVQDPSPGWIDSVSAAGAIYLSAALGVTQQLPGSMHLIGDQVPVDFVSNTIICSTAAKARQNKFSIVHSTSSSLNPISWEMVR